MFFSLNKKSSGREFQACFSASKSLQLASLQPSCPSSPLDHKMAAEAPSVMPPEDKAQGRKEEGKDSPPVSHQGGSLSQNTSRSLSQNTSFVLLAGSSHVPSLTYKGGCGENEGTCHLKPPSWEGILLARKKGLGNYCCRERKSIREGGLEEGMSRWPLQSPAQSYCQTHVGCSQC